MTRVLFALLLFLLPLGSRLLANNGPLFPENGPFSTPENEFEQRLRRAEMDGNTTAIAEICRQWHASGQYSPGLLDWNYNALMSVETGALLLTHGNLDTWPAVMLQNALGVRPDVTVLNLELLADANYRARAAQRFASKTFPIAGATLEAFLQKLLSPENPQATYCGVMTDKDLLRGDAKSFYLTGLALKFSPKSFDNVAALRQNYEQRFRTDYLKLELRPEPSPEVVARINLNYIPAFALLHRHYEASGENGKAATVRDISLDLARRGGQEGQVRQLFGLQNTVEATAPKSAFTPKALEKSMKKVGENLYAAEAETTNEQYLRFLTDLLHHQKFDLLNVCRTTKTDWRALLPEAARALSDAELFKHAHPDDPEAPIQNISHAAAVAYCDWLTEVYNAAPGKKKFKKVRFRLPTAEEWEVAARAGRREVPYPWGGYFVRNSKGCYLLNCQADIPCGDCPETKEANDGGFFTVKVDTYFPNDFGLYNISGNVAEMLQQPGQAKGGSWADDPYHCSIPTQRIFTAPEPSIGFRVFMDVLE